MFVVTLAISDLCMMTSMVSSKYVCCESSYIWSMHDVSMVSSKYVCCESSNIWSMHDYKHGKQ